MARIAGKSGKKLKNEIVEMYPELFKGLGGVEPEHHIKLNGNASPVIHPPMKISIGLHGKLKKELDSMEKSGWWTRLGQFSGFGEETQWWAENLSGSKGQKQRIQKSITIVQNLRKLQADWAEQ